MQNPIMSQVQVGEITYNICDLEGRMKTEVLENTMSTARKILGEQGTAYAIYNEADNTLTFFRANETYTPSDTSATDIMGNTYTGTIYTGIEDYTTAPAPWDDVKTNIKKIVIADSQYIVPKSCTKWFSDTPVEELKNISQLDFKYTTDLSYMFANCANLTTLPDLSEWDTSNVTNMEHMFDGCGATNFKSISKWDTSNVTNMSNMFNNSNLHSDTESYIFNWDTSSVTDFSNMFANYGGDRLYRISGWDTSAAKNMAGMFQSCPDMTSLSLGPNWDTSNVTNMDNMLNNCPNLVKDCSSWNVDRVKTHIDFAKNSPDVIEPNWIVTYAYAVLDSEGTLTFFRSEDEYTDGTNQTVTDVKGNSYTGQVYTGIETYAGTNYNSAPWYNQRSNIKLIKIADNQIIAPISCAGWFSGCSNMTDFEGAERLDTSNVTNMSRMFIGCSNAIFNPDVSNWDTSNVTDMSLMFQGCSGAVFNPDVSNWDTSKVTNISQMFYECAGAIFNPDVSNWDTSNVTHMEAMFSNCSGAIFNPDVSNWDTSNVTHMEAMFNNCSGAIFNPDVSNWDTSNVTSMSNMFNYCSSAVFNPNVGNWDTSNVTNMSRMFHSCSGAAFNPDVSNWNISKVTRMETMFYECSGAALNPDVSNWDTSNVTDMSNMFQSCSSAIFNPDVSNWDTSKVTNMGSMFSGCSGAIFNPDVSNWNTSNIINMSYMFNFCSGAALNPDVSNWDTSKVTNMEAMFCGCRGALFNPNVSNWDTSNVTNMKKMFYDCSGAAFNPDLSNWNTSKVTNISFMFSNCSGAIFNPDINNWDTSNIIDMSYMFYGCFGEVFNPDISGWNTSNVTNMNYMFFNCHGAAFSPDVNGWDISNVITMNSMFAGCSNLTTIYAAPDADWSVSTKLMSSSDMFDGCAKLKGGNNTIYNYSYKDKTYARVDKPGQPGYFTAKPSAYAVLDSAGTLTFFRSENTYNAGTGQTVTDVAGNSYTGQVYTGIETYKATNYNSAPWYNEHLSIKLAKIADNQIIAPIDCSAWFYFCSEMIAFEGAERLDTSAVTDMYSMFFGCSSMMEPPTVSGWDTSAITNMGSMFYGCSKIMSLDVSRWDFSKITNKSSYLGLQDCSALRELKVSVDAKIAGLPEHTTQGAYLATWGNAERGISGLTAANMMAIINAGNGAGTWKWEEALPISKGGTGATTAEDARTNLGVIEAKTTNGLAYGPLLSVTAEGHAEQDGTPTPSDPKEIVVVRGRNLLNNEGVSTATSNGVTFTKNEDGSVTANGTASGGSATYTLLNATQTKALPFIIGQTYTVSGGMLPANCFAQIYDDNGHVHRATFEFSGFGNSPNVSLYIANGTTVSNLTFYPQLELGSTAHPYVPYGHVGLDVTADGTTTTTPIPLPSRGWVGSLPDGTHDALSIDGAGRVTWELGVGKYEITGSETIASEYDFGTNYRIQLLRVLQSFASLDDYNLNGLCDRLVARAGWTTDATGFYYDLSAGRGHINCFVPNVDTTADALAAVTGAEFYYPLIPTTEDMGYIDLPDIPEDAVVSIPELEGLEVKSWTDDAVAEYASAFDTNGAAIRPASVTATGEISASKINNMVVQGNGYGNPVFKTSDVGTIFLRSYGLDRSKEDNGISQTRYPGVSINDKDDRISGRWECPVYTNGDVQFKLYVRQFDDAGTNTHQGGLDYILKRDGTGIWHVSTPEAFRSAIGLGSVTQNLTLSNATGTMKVVRNAIAVTLYLNGIKITDGLANNTTKTIGTVPAGFRPAASVFIIPYSSSTAHAGKMRVAIESNGTVSVRNVSGSTFPATTDFQAIATYVI